ncbi:MAG TPA: hypothetical protein DDZ22_01800 [Massilia sp.]|nr:hypothetical protein [Massilia sp.]
MQIERLGRRRGGRRRRRLGCRRRNRGRRLCRLRRCRRRLLVRVLGIVLVAFASRQACGDQQRQGKNRETLHGGSFSMKKLTGSPE